MISAELVDSSRMLRAKNVKIHTVDETGDRLPDHHYLALSRSGSIHYCKTKPEIGCDCGDFTWQHGNPHELPRPCKHILKAMWVEGHPVVEAIAEKLGLL